MADMSNTDYHKAGLVPYGRDCEHGQLARSCDRCEDKREIARLTAENKALREACEKIVRTGIGEAVGIARAALAAGGGK